MITSQETNLIDAAMVEIQQELKHAILDKKNPHLKNLYASLESIIDAIRPIASSKGISFQQFPEMEGDLNILTTRISHKSGQFYVSKMKLMVLKPGMQDLGSAITYAKRYALSSIFGVATGEGDDDGHATTIAPKQEEAKPIEAKNSKLISDAQKNFILQSFAKEGRDVEKMLYHFNIKTIEEMTIEQATTVINDIKKGSK